MVNDLRKIYKIFFAVILTFVTLAAAGRSTTLSVRAYKHGYNPGPGARFATVRHAISLYDSPGGSDLGYIPEFTGIKILGSEGSWYEVVFRKKKQYRYGWITKDEFEYDCLEYDGRDKQPMADGLYLFSRIEPEKNILTTSHYLESLEQYKLNVLRYLLHFNYDDHGVYYIRNHVTGKYMAPAATGLTGKKSVSGLKTRISWVSGKEKAGRFHLYRDGNGYRVTDQATALSLCITSDGLPGFEQNGQDLWRAVRSRPVIEKNNMRDYVQYDAEWASYHYGEGKSKRSPTDNFTTAGCGIFATVNAIYTVTGHFPDPYELADYAVKHYFRIVGSGTDSGFFEAAADAFGEKYGFRFAGYGETLKTLRSRLKKGQTAITHVPGHYVTIVAYNSKTKKYLLLDPHYLPKRHTCAFGDWVSAKTLSEDTLYAYNFYFYERTR